MEIKFTSKAYMPTLVTSGLILFAAIFLPWATAGGNASGTGVTGWGTMCTIAAMFGILLAYLTNAKIRAIGTIVVGGLAVVGAVIYATKLGGATVGYGLIIEMLFAVAAIIVGVQDYTKNGK